MPSELENAMARFRRQLLQQERAAASQMVRAYGESWARIRVNVLRVQAQLEAGDTSIWRIQQDARLQSIQRQVEAELRRFAPYAADSATTAQQAAIAAAQRDAAQAIEAAGGPSMRIRFDKMNPAAVEALVGFASDGSPLQTLFDGIGQDVAPRMTATLAKGIALGWNPRVTAREMRAAYGVGLNRALTIARTETLRAYRDSTAQNYRANAQYLEGWIWVCACDRRSCASCWAMHGSLHALDERLDDHPNGRCAMAPKVKGRPNRIGATGAERFDLLSADDQRYILGPGMYEAWKDGQVSLSPTGANSIVGRRDDAQWGTMRYARSLRDVVGPEAAKAYSGVAAGKGAAPVKAAPVAPTKGPVFMGNVRDFVTGIPTKGPLAEALREATTAIESVHGVDAGQTVPFKVASRKSYDAAYTIDSLGKPKSLEVNKEAYAPSMAFTHEMGHYFDHQSIHLETRINNGDKAMSAWRDAVNNSAAVQQLRGLKKGDVVEMFLGKPIRADMKYTEYLLRDEEIWARSYAQYIAKTSGNKVMLTELDAIRKGKAYLRHWDDDDFAPIAKAIDDIFVSIGARQ